jgi:hypothetical protein
VTHERAAEYRRRAQACMMTASTVKSQERRAALIAMAESWLRLAENASSVSEQQQKRIEGEGN